MKSEMVLLGCTGLFLFVFVTFQRDSGIRLLFFNHISFNNTKSEPEASWCVKNYENKKSLRKILLFDRICKFIMNKLTIIIHFLIALENFHTCANS